MILSAGTGSSIPAERAGAATALVRSDQTAINVLKGAAMVNEPLPNSTVGTRFQQGALWIDCYL